MGFRVGDKVRVIHNSNGSGIVRDAMNKIGVVKSIRHDTIYHNSETPGMVYVEFNEIVFADLLCVGFFKNEIEKVNIKGQQLVFSFME